MLALHTTTYTVSNTKQTAVEQSGGAGPTMGGAIVGMRVGIFGTGYAGLVMQTPIVVDGRNLFEPAQMRAAGFEYYSLGRGEATFRTEPKRVRV